jgi:hypothetical protein
MAGEGMTNYLGVVGSNAAFPDKGTIMIQDFTKGTSHTIMLVEVPDEAAVEWTRPEDFRIETKEPVKKLVGLRKQGFLTAFADGAPQFVSEDIPEKLLRFLFNRDTEDENFQACKPWLRFVPPAAGARRSGSPQPEQLSKTAGGKKQMPYLMMYPVGDLVCPTPNVVAVTEKQVYALPPVVAVTEKQVYAPPPSHHPAPPPEGVVAAAGQQFHKPALPPGEPDFKSLVDLIVSTVSPKTWQQNGGQGTITHSKPNLCIVVSQTQEVQAEIADLLGQLRQMGNIGVCLETRFITLDADSCSKIGVNHDSVVLDRSKASDLINLVQKRQDARLLQVPRVTLINGQAALFSEPANGHTSKSCKVQAIISHDRRHVRLTVMGERSSNTGQIAVNVKDGESLVVNLSRRLAGDVSATAMVAHGTEILLLITPQICINEAEEAARP